MTVGLSGTEVPKQNEKVLPQILTILSASLCFLISGMLFSWPSPSIPQLISKDGPYNFTLEECSYLPVLPEITMMISGLFYPRLADKIGRKATLLSISLPYCISLVLTATAGNIYLFYLARLSLGVGDSLVISTLPSYIGEISVPGIRGFWGNTPACFGLLGHLFSNAVGGYLDIVTTAWIMLLFPIIFIVTFSFAPESPYYYIMKSKREKARRVLQKLRGCEDVDDELLLMERAVQRQMSETCTWMELFRSKSNRKGLIAGGFLRSAQVLSGMACFSAYNQYIFDKSANLSAANCAIIFNMFLICCTVGSMYFIDKLGRRISVIVSSFGCGLSLICVSAYFYMEQKHPSVITNLSWIPLAGMLVYVMLYSFGLSTVPSLMLGELFSAAVKAKALTVLIFVVGFWVSVTAKVFQLLDTNLGRYSPFAFFSVCCFGSMILAYYLVPETKGKTLEEIQLSLKR